MFQPMYYALNNLLPVGDTITFDRTYVMPGVAVEYRYDLFIGDLHYGSSTGAPLRCGLPDGSAGKKATLIVSYRQNGTKHFTTAESLQVKIAPRALFPNIPNATIKVGEPLLINVYQGINPQMPLPAGAIVHVEDDRGGTIFKADVPVKSVSIKIPMRMSANVTAPTALMIRISTNIPNQLDDEEALTIVPNSSPTALDRSVAELENILLKDLPYNKMIAGVLSKDECDNLAHGLQTVLRSLRTPATADPAATIGVKSATCEVIWVQDEMKIVRLFLTTCIAKQSNQITFDKKTGETIARAVVSESDVEDIDVRRNDLEKILTSPVTEGTFAGKTLNDELRASACLK